MNTTALLLALCAAIGADDFEWAVTDASAFSWSITTNGGDASLPQDAAVPGTDAPTSPRLSPVAPQSPNGHVPPGFESVGDEGIVSPGSVAAPPTETATEPLTTVCQCLGFNEAVCHCRKHGQVCHCTRTSGSVWAVNERGQATHKTGAKADPRVGPGQKTAGNVPGDDTVPRKRSDGRYWWKGSNGTWFGTATLTEGQTYVSGTNRFVYRDGKMHEGAKMAADITPKAPKGHWVRRCYGGYCRMEWVPE